MIIDVWLSLNPGGVILTSYFNYICKDPVSKARSHFSHGTSCQDLGASFCGVEGVGEDQSPHCSQLILGRFWRNA